MWQRGTLRGESLFEKSEQEKEKVPGVAKKSENTAVRREGKGTATRPPRPGNDGENAAGGAIFYIYVILYEKKHGLCARAL